MITPSLQHAETTTARVIPVAAGVKVRIDDGKSACLHGSKREAAALTAI